MSYAIHLPSHQSGIPSLRITERDGYYCAFTPVLHSIRHFEDKYQSFPYDTLMSIIDNNIINKGIYSSPDIRKKEDPEVVMRRYPHTPLLLDLVTFRKKRSRDQPR
jgi:hypothetical protein